LDNNECDDACIEFSITSSVAKKFHLLDLISHFDSAITFTRHQTPGIFSSVSSSFTLNSQDSAFVDAVVAFRSAENFLDISAPLLYLRLSQLLCQKTKTCLSFLRVLYANDVELSKCVHVPSADWLEKKKTAALEPLNIPAISMQNEIFVLSALKNACYSALAKYPTSYEQDLLLLKSHSSSAPLSLAHQNILKLLIGEKRTLRFWSSVSSEIISVLRPFSPDLNYDIGEFSGPFQASASSLQPQSSTTPSANISESKPGVTFSVLRNRMEKSEFAKNSQARKYFREVWSPLLKKAFQG
jgi:hypothetical protein